MNATHSKETPIGGCLERLVGLPTQMSFWPLGEPDERFYIQADGKFVLLNDADDSAIPYSIACASAQEGWPRLANIELRRGAKD